jgi:hypothetical protein
MRARMCGADGGVAESVENECAVDSVLFAVVVGGSRKE